MRKEYPSPYPRKKSELRENTRRGGHTPPAETASVQAIMTTCPSRSFESTHVPNHEQAPTRTYVPHSPTGPTGDAARQTSPPVPKQEQDRPSPALAAAADTPPQAASASNTHGRPSSRPRSCRTTPGSQPTADVDSDSGSGSSGCYPGRNLAANAPAPAPRRWPKGAPDTPRDGGSQTAEPADHAQWERKTSESRAAAAGGWSGDRLRPDVRAWRSLAPSRGCGGVRAGVWAGG